MKKSEEIKQAQSNQNAEPGKMVDDCISRQAALNMRFSAGYNVDGVMYVPLRDVTEWLRALPPVQDEKLERCLFEYINACRTANCPTQDTTRKDRRDAYAVIKVLQPIFGDVTF